MSWKEFFGLKPQLEQPVYQGDPHTHQFETKFITYAEPRRDVPSVSGNEKLVEKALFGSTSILSKCILCPETKLEEMVGTDHPHIDEMLDKVDDYGPQYMQRNNVTYLIQRYQQPAAQQMTALPIR